MVGQDADVASRSQGSRDARLREWFHAAAAIGGGERSWMSAAVNLSMTTIGAPSWGSSGTHGSQGPMRHGVRLVMAVLCRASEIGDGHAMGVATQIVEHTSGPPTAPLSVSESRGLAVAFR